MKAGSGFRGRAQGRRAAARHAAFAVAAAALLAGGQARAQSGAAVDGWQYEITPYFWAAGMKGTVQAGSLPRTSVDIGFSDIWDNLDFGAMAAFEARKGSWGLLFDAVYMKVSTSAVSSVTGGGPLGATLTAGAGLKLEQSMFAAAASWRVGSGPAAVDLIGGLRYSNLDVDASIDASLFGQTGHVARSGDKDWVDPYVGARVQFPLADRWTAVGYADVGGFGAGSKLSWQALLGINYDFSKTVSGKFGYRRLDVDYDKGGFLYDMATGGFYAGVGIRF